MPWQRSPHGWILSILDNDLHSLKFCPHYRSDDEEHILRRKDCLSINRDPRRVKVELEDDGDCSRPLAGQQHPVTRRYTEERRARSVVRPLHGERGALISIWPYFIIIVVLISNSCQNIENYDFSMFWSVVHATAHLAQFAAFCHVWLTHGWIIASWFVYGHQHLQNERKEKKDGEGRGWK